jgi:hypothetical protein
MFTLSSSHLLLLPGRALLKHAGQLDESRQGSAGEEEGWEAALTSLGTVLNRKNMRARLQVSLSHHFASMHVVKSPPVRLAGDEMRGWLQSQLVQDYGVEAETWQLAWQDVPPGYPVPVSSFPLARLERLITQLAEAGVAAHGIRPWFVTAWNRYHRELSRDSSGMALLEKGRLLLVRTAGKQMRQVSMSRMTDAPAAPQLAAAISRQSLLMPVQTTTVNVERVHLIAPENREDFTAVDPKGAAGKRGLSAHPHTPDWGMLL